MEEDINKVLLRVGINPKTVLKAQEAKKNTCPWCQQGCGTMAILTPCQHIICPSCLEAITDSKEEICPHCLTLFQDFTWLHG